MKLITEIQDEDKVETLIVEEAGVKNVYIKGVYLQSAIKNKNGRVYSPEIMESAVNKYRTDKIENACAYGELNHPNTPQINLERASHLIKELVKEGNNYIGNALILNTPMGNIARGLLEGGARLGVSSRGLGTLIKKNGIQEVQADFRLSTAADIVSDPSAPDAYVDAIMENVEWAWNEQLGWQAVQITEQIQKQLNKSVRSLNEADRMKAFELFVARVGSVYV